MDGPWPAHRTTRSSRRPAAGRSTRRGDVVVLAIIRVPGDRRQYDMVHGTDVCQGLGDLLRLGEVQSDTPCVATQLCSRRVGVRLLTASENYGPTLVGVVARDLLADTTSAASDQQ